MGPLTNLACAIIKDHEVEVFINHVYFYGGNIYGIGNGMNSVSERNCSMDVDAFHLVTKVFTQKLIVIPNEASLQLK